MCTSVKKGRSPDRFGRNRQSANVGHLGSPALPLLHGGQPHVPSGTKPCLNIEVPSMVGDSERNPIGRNLHQTTAWPGRGALRIPRSTSHHLLVFSRLPPSIAAWNGDRSTKSPLRRTKTSPKLSAQARETPTCAAARALRIRHGIGSRATTSKIALHG